MLKSRFVGYLLLAVCAPPALAQSPQACVATGIHADSVPALARAAMAGLQHDKPAPDPATLFRLQLLAGQPAAALASIASARSARHSPPAQPPLYLQYEIHARAQLLQAQRNLPYAQVWRQVFRERFGALTDATALQAEFGFGAALPGLQADAAAALVAANGQRCLPLPAALELLRKQQVATSYAAFLPLFAAALQEDDARRYVIDRNLKVRTPDGAQIAAVLVRPAHAKPLPTLLQFTIYANDDWAWADAKKMASRGYVSVMAYARGKGRSRDAITPFANDGSDAAAVIGWAAAQPFSDGRVGMYGGSYSGYTQWAALTQRPPALRAIATSATTAPGIDVPMEGGVFLNFMAAWPVYVASNRGLNDTDYGDSARWNRLNRSWYASGRAYRELPAIDSAPNPVFSNWLQHPGYDAWWQAMIPQGDAFASIDIPVLATTGYFDGAQIGVLHYFREHLRHRPTADHTLLIGPYEHFSMQTGVPPQVQGYPVDPGARIDLQALRLDWFDHVFKGAPKPTLLANRVNWQVMGSDRWRHAPTLAAMATRQQRYYLLPGSGGNHRLAIQAQPDTVTTQRVDFADRSDADWRPSPLVLNPHIDPHAGLVFASAPMPQATEFAGPFTGQLNFIINKRDVDICIGVAERRADGSVLDLAFWIQRASVNANPRHRQLLTVNTPQHLRVDHTRLLGRTLAAGSQLIVTLGVLKQPDHQLNLGSGKPPAEETLADAGVPLEIRWAGSSWLEFGIRE